MPDPQTLTYKRKFTTTITGSEEGSIKDEKKDSSDIRIYTDGLGYKGKVGTTAVLYGKGANELEKILHYYLGSLTNTPPLRVRL